MNSSLAKKIKSLPDAPGVYFFLGSKKYPRKSANNQSQSVIMYVGKATSLRDRVKSYLGKDIFETRGPLIERMISEVKDIDFQETDSVLEALILEANLIKKHKPKYNSLGKDDKSWNYVVITDEEFPRIFTLRETELRTINYKLKTAYGSFPHGGQLREALKIIRKIFPFRDRKSKISHNERFYRQINLSPDITSKEAKKEYQKTIRHIKLFFEGKKKKLVSLLEREMKKEAKDQNFEKAGKLRNQIFALNHIQDIALLKTINPGRAGYKLSTLAGQAINCRIEAYDIAHISGKFVVGAMVVLEGGEVKKSDYRKFKIKKEPGVDDTRALKEVLERRFQHPEWPWPDLIVVDGGVAQKRVAERVVKEQKLKTPIVSVVKNEKHKPDRILGPQKIVKNYQKEILLSNSEAHRFVLAFHRQLRGKLK